MLFFIICLLAQCSRWVRSKYGGRWEYWSCKDTDGIWLPHNFYQKGNPIPGETLKFLKKEVW